MSPAEPTLGPAKGLEKAVPRHRAALERCAATLGSLAPAVWTAPRGPGKWSPAQIGEHLILSYDILLTELSGGAGFRVRNGLLAAHLHSLALPRADSRGRAYPGGRAGAA